MTRKVKYLRPKKVFVGNLNIRIRQETVDALDSLPRWPRRLFASVARASVEQALTRFLNKHRKR